MSALSDIAGRRIQGTYEVDPWGLDIELLEVVSPLARLRWSIDVDGADVVPAGPALLRAPRRLLAPASEAFVVALAVRRATGRPLRVLGVPDVAPIGPMLRRLGGAVDHPAEARALLRAGHLVLSRHDFPGPSGRQSGLLVDAPVINVHTRGWELGRRWRVCFTMP